MKVVRCQKRFTVTAATLLSCQAFFTLFGKLIRADINVANIMLLFPFLSLIFSDGCSPFSVRRSTSTVGFPRESKISLATMLTIDILRDTERQRGKRGIVTIALPRRYSLCCESWRYASYLTVIGGYVSFRLKWENRITERDLMGV